LENAFAVASPIPLLAPVIIAKGFDILFINQGDLFDRPELF
jgi:hypothetical protein